MNSTAFLCGRRILAYAIRCTTLDHVVYFACTLIYRAVALSTSQDLETCLVRRGGKSEHHSTFSGIEIAANGRPAKFKYLYLNISERDSVTETIPLTLLVISY